MDGLISPPPSVCVAICTLTTHGQHVEDGTCGEPRLVEADVHHDHLIEGGLISASWDQSRSYDAVLVQERDEQGVVRRWAEAA